MTFVCRRSRIVLYADDTVLYISDRDLGSIQSALSDDLNYVSDWLSANRLTLNVNKTKSMLFGTPHMLEESKSIDINFGSEHIEQVESFKYLGVTLDSKLSFDVHLNNSAKRVAYKVGVSGRVRNYLSPRHLEMVYNAIVLPHFDYASTVWSGTCAKYTNPLVSLQVRAGRVILGAKNLLWKFLEGCPGHP